MHPFVRRSALLSLLVWSFVPLNGYAHSPGRSTIERLEATYGAGVKVSMSRATGTARFVRLPHRDQPAIQSVSRQSAEERARQFLDTYGDIFGLRHGSGDLQLLAATSDALGAHHLTYQQTYRGLPVFAALLRVHTAPGGEIAAVNGTVIADLSLDVTPALAPSAAATTALRVAGQPILGSRDEAPRRAIDDRSGTTLDTMLQRPDLRLTGSRLVIYRTNLAAGIPGHNHLAYEVTIADVHGTRELVLIDAHDGSLVDRLPMRNAAMDRRAFDGLPSYPGSPFWQEGDPLPTVSVDANESIEYSKDAYDFFKTAFGRSSYDGADGTLDVIFDAALADCPNAYWQGRRIEVCAGIPADDLIAHEWTHGFTQYTDALFYWWQPGALNESFSDIFGETVDLINGKGTDSPGGLRSDGTCSAYTPRNVFVHVTSGAFEDDLQAGRATFGPSVPNAGLSGTVVLADDGSGATDDGCEAFLNDAMISGRIALVQRGLCDFVTKVKNAQNAGAIGVIVYNHAPGGDVTFDMSGSDPSISIPSVFIGHTDGTTILGELAAGVTATLSVVNDPREDSYRWLLFEDSESWGGAIRDMWSPNCYGQPARVSDPLYTCALDDLGGSHTNSGVPNHAYALVVDGGTYNGQTVTGIGLTKAAHIYYRAMSTYQVPVSDFADHADALEQACSDLIGANLADLSSGAASGEIVTTGDCAQISNAIEAVELRLPPSQCAFTPPLDPAQPSLWNGGTEVFFEDFEGSVAGWSFSNGGVLGSWVSRDWAVDASLPAGRSGSAAKADPLLGICDWVGGVLHLDSPSIPLPAGGVPMLTFTHYVATWPDLQGGNLKVSVNGGPWTLIDTNSFAWNGYISTLIPPPDNVHALAGQPAFNGVDPTGAHWVTSAASLAPYAAAGDTIRLRFDFGTNGCLAPGTWNSLDDSSAGWFIDDVRVAMLDSVSMTSLTNLATSESGTSDSFQVVLSAPPSASVAIALSSSDPSEGSVSPSSVQFDATNWNVPQTVTVTGVDDAEDDGDVPYSIVTAPAASGDLRFQAVDLPDVNAINADDDQPAVAPAEIPALTGSMLAALAAILAAVAITRMKA